jgi:CDP-glucose 4,6-dehydratase
VEFGESPVEGVVSTAQRPWQGRRVLVTGHTGFKGGWLSVWLDALGAEVFGLALPPADPSLYRQCGLDSLIESHYADIGDYESTRELVAAAAPEIVFHLAAQSRVGPSYQDPVGTYRTNVMGTVHLLEACRKAGSVRAAVVITSDKCYENREWSWPYREIDPMGGHDTYSSSKGCAELAVASWRRSFFGDGQGLRLASARAGNVIGGGDWGLERLVPDCVRAIAGGVAVNLRNPNAVRPWQHVLDALAGYLLLCERLLASDDTACTAWNFGPGSDDMRPVCEVVSAFAERCGGGLDWRADPGPHPHEAGLLTLDSSKARRCLGWRPRLDFDEALEWTAGWYARQRAGEDALSLCREQIALYQARARASA